jgi:hypothetical protein
MEVLRAPTEPLNVTVGKLRRPRDANLCVRLRHTTLARHDVRTGRSSSCEGTPNGIAIGLGFHGCVGMENVEAGWPISMAMACSNCARLNAKVGRLGPGGC